MQTIKFEISGITPLLMHNSRLCDPLDEYTQALKKVSSVRKKTEEHHQQIAEIEAIGGMYWDNGPYIPGDCIEAAIVGGAKLSKLGTAFKRGAQVLESVCPLIASGVPSTPEELVKNEDFLYRKAVKVGQSRVMRTRVMFKDWSTEFSVVFDEGQIRREDIKDAVTAAGMFIGLCDWRPRFGKFEVVPHVASVS